MMICLQVGRFGIFDFKIIYYERKFEVGSVIDEDDIDVVALCVSMFAEVAAEYVIH